MLKFEKDFFCDILYTMKVTKKQCNSKMCIVCGLENELGLKAPFYEMHDGSVMSIFQFKEEHQSYPLRVHGGLITAMLDELGLRCLWTIEQNSYGVTIEITTKFRKPVPYNIKLKGIGKVVSNTKRFLHSYACILDKENNILAEADIKYLKMSTSKIVSNDFIDDEHNVYVKDNVTDIQ